MKLFASGRKKPLRSQNRADESAFWWYEELEDNPKLRYTKRA